MYVLMMGETHLVHGHIGGLVRSRLHAVDGV